MAEGTLEGLRGVGVLFERTEQGVDAFDAAALSGFAQGGLEDAADRAGEAFGGLGRDLAGGWLRGGGCASKEGAEETLEVLADQDVLADIAAADAAYAAGDVVRGVDAVRALRPR